MDATSRRACPEPDRQERDDSNLGQDRRSGPPPGPDVRGDLTLSLQPLIPLVRPSRALYAFTGVSTVVGLLVLAGATLTVPLAPAIALRAPEVVGRDPTAAGLLFWTLLGLTGSLRASSLGGHAVLTFHLPFIVAAMLLGGPVAGGWVAFVSTIELREIREVPWYGVLANHATQALAAVLGGLAAIAALRLADAWVAPDAAVLVGALAGAIAFAAVVIAHAAITISMRERLTLREMMMVFDGSWRTTIAAECVVAWVLAFVYQAMGWWAPMVCVVLVLLVWDAHDSGERVAHDEMTGLLNRHGFLARLSGAVAGVRRSGVSSLLIMLDLDGFKQVNDQRGHAAGDEVLQIVGERLRASTRITDVVARVGGDEFLLLLSGVRDHATARALADRIHRCLEEPIVMADFEVRVGSSLGLVFIDGRPMVSLPRLIAEADRAMYAAKVSGGGVRFSRMASMTPTLTA